MIGAIKNCIKTNFYGVILFLLYLFRVPLYLLAVLLDHMKEIVKIGMASSPFLIAILACYRVEDWSADKLEIAWKIISTLCIAGFVVYLMLGVAFIIFSIAEFILNHILSLIYEFVDTVNDAHDLLIDKGNQSFQELQGTTKIFAYVLGGVFTLFRLTAGIISYVFKYAIILFTLLVFGAGIWAIKENLFVSMVEYFSVGTFETIQLKDKLLCGGMLIVLVGAAFFFAKCVSEDLQRFAERARPTLKITYRKGITYRGAVGQEKDFEKFVHDIQLAIHVEQAFMAQMKPYLQDRNYKLSISDKYKEFEKYHTYIIKAMKKSSLSYEDVQQMIAWEQCANQLKSEIVGTINHINGQKTQENEKRTNTEKVADGYIFFKGCKNAEEVALRYKQLSKIYHPDGAAGDEDSFKSMSAEYAKIKATFK